MKSYRRCHSNNNKETHYPMANEWVAREQRDAEYGERAYVSRKIVEADEAHCQERTKMTHQIGVYDNHISKMA